MGTPDKSESLEKGHQLWRRVPFSGSTCSEASPLPEGIEYLAFHLQVRRDIATGCADRRVPKEVSNHRHIDARLQKGHRATVAEHVRGHATKPWRRDALAGKANILLQQVGHTIPGERRATMAPKEDVIAAFGMDDAAQGRCGLRPQRTEALLPTFAQKPHLSRTIQPKIAGAYSQCFANARARVVEEQE